MRFPLLLAAIGLAVSAQSADAQRLQRDQDTAYRAMQQGHILSLTTIRTRIQVRGAEFIGAELDPTGTVYRLKFMRGSEVIWIDVDARTGRPIGRR